MFKSKNALLFGSFFLILLGITIVTILDRTKQSQSEDIRAKASAVGSLVMTATIASVDNVNRQLTVDNLQFENKAGESIDKSLGTWSVTLPSTVNLTSLYPGAQVTMIVDPATFLAATHTLTAKEIKVIRQ